VQLSQKDALLSAISSARKPIAYLVGSPLSTDTKGNGVPDIVSILDIVRGVVKEYAPLAATSYEDTVAGKTGPSAYQSAMDWLQSYVHQDAVNTVIRRAVLKACTCPSSVGDPNDPTTDGDPGDWLLPAGTRALASVVCGPDTKYSGPILTPNFDPLLSLAIRGNGRRPSLRVLDIDGSLPRDIEEDDDARTIIHLHGYWRGADTLHTPAQLQSPRPKLKASLQRLLRSHLLIVIAYGGWDDVFTNALTELLHDNQTEVDVLWGFFETNPAFIQAQYKNLLENVSPAIARGRFRYYGGIDCHSIFSDLAARLNIPSEAIELTSIKTAHVAIPEVKEEVDLIDRHFTKRLEDALQSFSSQPKLWVNRVIATRPEITKDRGAAEEVKIEQILSDIRSIVIKASPQFGQTCLAHYLIREAWRTLDKAFWLYLDCKTLRANPVIIKKGIDSELFISGYKREQIKCVVIDSWTYHGTEHRKILNEIIQLFTDTRIIILETVDQVKHFLEDSEPITINRKFDQLYLWALPRSDVRKVVEGYNKCKHIGDENLVTSKVVSDLEVLNLHRTPLNCILLLKASEVYFEESPVNRAEMINRVLFLLFNVDDIPTYKIKPDLKDCEYVLGYLCEQMIRESNYFFTRDYFINELECCCKTCFIDLEVQVVFDVLAANHIVVSRGDQFSFRFAYWLYYFAAHRMHHDKNFAEYILAEKRYANYPEIIEFYTGIDRRREDALQVMIDDVRATCDKVKERCGFESFNPYKFAQWRPSVATLEQMKSEIADGVKNSKLPASIKDSYADRTYDPTRPYHQEIRSILEKYSFDYMAQTMRAGGRALRNSDYVNPETKRQLLVEIMRCWEQVSTVLLVLVPLLIRRGKASFDGSGFFLAGNFGNTLEERFQTLLNELPANVVGWFKDDLFSQKMGPLLFDQLMNETNNLVKHELILLLIAQRPRGWKEPVYKYIIDNNKNSFYLWDVYRTLRSEYRYSFASDTTLSDVRFLIQMAIAKHDSGSKMPGINLIKKYKNAVPNRLDNDYDRKVNEPEAR